MKRNVMSLIAISLLLMGCGNGGGGETASASDILDTNTYLDNAHKIVFGNRSMLDEVVDGYEVLDSIFEEIRTIDISQFEEIDKYEGRYDENDYACLQIQQEDNRLYYMFYDTEDDSKKEVYVVETTIVQANGRFNTYPSGSQDVDTVESVLHKYHGTIDVSDIDYTYELARTITDEVISGYDVKGDE